jgi:eukaryotic-like serine/threonine-protein kinase
LLDHAPAIPSPHRTTQELPEHLRNWRLPPGWRWGSEGVWLGDYRFSMEVVDSLDRSLSLVTAPDPGHHPWLAAEARRLAHLNHPAVPTTYHYWADAAGTERGPGYLRRWIAGETIGARVRRVGPEGVAYMLTILRSIGSALAYLHDSGTVHGAVNPHTVWVTPTGRIWMLGWQWAVPKSDIPTGIVPDVRWTPFAPEWQDGSWQPTEASDQWQLAAACFLALTGEEIPQRDAPPVRWLMPECPEALARLLDQALAPRPEHRFPSVAALLRDLDRVAGSRSSGQLFISGATQAMPREAEGPEARLRWALGDDYELLGKLGTGASGDVWKVRDLALEREVALKVLHPNIASDAAAMATFRREAQLAAQLAHPSLVRIYDFDLRGGVVWYTMELAENGSLADLIKRDGPRTQAELSLPISALLDGLHAAHSIGILHRDLKPENILIDRWRHWRIADFGLARIHGEERTGASGTPSFAAPEQLLNEPQGPAADFFAMAGIVLFALTGRAPFGGGEIRTILGRQLGGLFDAGGVPENLVPWIARGLAAEPDARWPDAAAMRAAWREAVR